LARLAPQAAVRLQKTLSVRRCQEAASLLWWSQPLSLTQFSQVFRNDLRGAEATVLPADALDAVDAALLAVGDDLVSEPSGSGAVGVQVATNLLQRRHDAPATLRLTNIAALMSRADAGRLAPCQVTIEPQPGRPFCTMQIPQHNAAQVQFRFHRHGDAVRALASLTLGRGFGGDPVAAEQALLQHKDFANGTSRELQLILENGAARLEAFEDGGRRRVCYLQSGRGYCGDSERRSRWQVWRAAWNEERRRFPVKVVLFAGLPVFIAIFRAGGALLRRVRP
jgi:hypothetical protein